MNTLKLTLIHTHLALHLPTRCQITRWTTQTPYAHTHMNKPTPTHTYTHLALHLPTRRQATSWMTQIPCTRKHTHIWTHAHMNTRTLTHTYTHLALHLPTRHQATSRTTPALHTHTHTHHHTHVHTHTHTWRCTCPHSVKQWVEFSMWWRNLHIQNEIRVEVWFGVRYWTHIYI